MSESKPSFKLLQRQNESLLKHFYQTALRKKYMAEEAISWQGDPCEFVYFIVTGAVEIFRLSPAGREQILDRLSQGECFNLVPAVLDGGLNQTNARALTDCELLLLAKGEFLQLLNAYPEFLKTVAIFYAERLVRMTALIENLSLYTVRQRVARFLIEQADMIDQGQSIRWTQSDMAKRLGTVRDVLGRTLRKLADDGLVRFEHEKIVLVDRQQLEKEANGAL